MPNAMLARIYTASESWSSIKLSPSPIVLITVLYFSAIAIFQALVERFAFLDYANSLQDVGYLFGLNNDCLALCLASPSNVSQFVLGKHKRGAESNRKLVFAHIRAPILLGSICA